MVDVTMDRVGRMEAALRQAFAPHHLSIEDEGARHRGHAGAASGAGHFRVVIVSDRFHGQDRLSRHRAVYAALRDAMQREIHALAVETFTPAEWRSRAHRP
jgi:BolA protein